MALEQNAWKPDFSKSTKHYANVWNTFTVNNKELGHDVIVDFEQVNASWIRSFWGTAQFRKIFCSTLFNYIGTGDEEFNFFLSYKKQSIDFLLKSLDLFLPPERISKIKKQLNLGVLLKNFVLKHLVKRTEKFCLGLWLKLKKQDIVGVFQETYWKYHWKLIWQNVFS